MYLRYRHHTNSGYVALVTCEVHGESRKVVVCSANLTIHSDDPPQSKKMVKGINTCRKSGWACRLSGIGMWLEKGSNTGHARIYARLREADPVKLCTRTYPQTTFIFYDFVIHFICVSICIEPEDINNFGE
jgi:hypothetical protein